MYCVTRADACAVALIVVLHMPFLAWATNRLGRVTPDSKYGRGVYYFDLDDIGVKHCSIPGQIHSRGDGRDGSAPVRLEVFLKGREHEDRVLV
jgi:hypothetical protein